MYDPAWISRTARRLDAAEPTIADGSYVPRQIAVGLVRLYELEDDVNLNGTAQDILNGVFEFTDQPDGRNALARGDSKAVSKAIDSLINAMTFRGSPDLVGPPSAAIEIEMPTNKLDAVNAVSGLTQSGPEQLGPGSKERKRVLENLHRGLGFGPAPSVSKPELGRLIAERLGGTWDDSCWSTGYTVTLQGLNRLLVLAKTHLGATASDQVSPTREAAVLLQIAAEAVIHSSNAEHGSTRYTWDGRACVSEMLQKSYPHARQTEWPGWYFEFITLPVFRDRFNVGGKMIGNTTFDYVSNNVWDLKVHDTKKGDKVILNDKRSIEQAFKEYSGIGIIVNEGSAGFEGEREFYGWHAGMRQNVTADQALLNRGPKSRKLKTSFTHGALKAYWLPASSGFSNDALSYYRQGKQASGAERELKVMFDLSKARRFVVAEFRFNRPTLGVRQPQIA